MAKLRISYFKIIKLKEYINDTYSLQFFISTASIFIEYVYFTFFIIVILRTPGPIDLPKSRVLQIFMWTSSLGSRLFTMIKTCHTAAQKIKKTGSVINNILSKPVDPHTKNEVGYLFKNVFST